MLPMQCMTLLIILATILYKGKELSVVHAIPQFEGWGDEQGYVEPGPENNWGGFGTEEMLDHHVAYG